MSNRQAIAKMATMILMIPVLLGSVARVAADNGAAATVAWFTDADIQDKVAQIRPDDAPGALDTGTFGAGCPLERPIALALGDSLERQAGMISFWLLPKWNGDDGQRHLFLKIGDPERSGLLVEKSARGMLRFVLASPEKVTAARCDASHWKPEVWRHVAVAWESFGDTPIALRLFVDGEAAARSVASGNTFVDFAKLADPRLWIGDVSARAVMDELVWRKGVHAPLQRNSRDYFQTAPYSKIEITPNPCGVASDSRVVNGFRKQFGLLATRSDTGAVERLTRHVAGAEEERDSDASPFIDWISSNGEVAEVNETGEVRGWSVGSCKLVAEYRKLWSVYSQLQVISPDQPDLGLISVSRPMPSAGAAKAMEATVHFGNFGYQPIEPGAALRLELIAADGKTLFTKDATLDRKLEPFDRTEAHFTCPRVSGAAKLRVTLDPDGRVAELCEANNQSVETLDAKPVRYPFPTDAPGETHAKRRMNLTGSFSYYDYVRAHHERLLLPTGADFRIDGFDPAKNSVFPPRDESRQNTVAEFKTLRALARHAWGLPDIGGFVAYERDFRVLDKNYIPYAGRSALPERDAEGRLSFGALGAGAGSLMDGQASRPHPGHAALIGAWRNVEGDRAFDEWSAAPIHRNTLQFFALDDAPLAGAAVYVYQSANVAETRPTRNYFPDRAKFTGITDKDGLFRFPDRTASSWDDPATAETEGSRLVAGPLHVGGRPPAPPDEQGKIEGMLVIRVADGEGNEEFHQMTPLDFLEAFGRNPLVGLYPIRSSLRSPARPAAVVQKQLPDSVLAQNLPPLAVPTTTTLAAQCGKPYELKASKSVDPEGARLEFEWTREILDRKAPEGRRFEFVGNKMIMEMTAPNEPGVLVYYLTVYDGLRFSARARVEVAVSILPR